MILYFYIACAFGLLLVASVLSLFFTSTRRFGKFTLLALTIIAVVVGIVTYMKLQPLSFDKNYQVNAPDVLELTVKNNASNAGVYIGGAPRGITQMQSKEFNQVFNSITPENALKISDVLDVESMTYDFTVADEMVDYAIAQDIRIRGHALIFGKLSDTYKSPDLDKWLAQFPDEEKAKRLSLLFNTHIETMLNHYKGRILQWDVINEPLAMFGNGQLEENVFYRYLGKQYIEEAFIKAKAIDSNVTLYLNEQFYNYTDERAEAFYQLVVSLLEKGVPIEGIGLQGHMLFYLAAPQETANYVERFTKLGLKVQLTEFEARLRLFKDASDPYQAQGEYYRDVMAACYGIKGFDGVTFWGVDDSESWLNDMSWMFPLPNEPYLLDAQRKAKPGLILINEFLKSFEPNR